MGLRGLEGAERSAGQQRWHLGTFFLSVNSRTIQIFASFEVLHTLSGSGGLHRGPVPLGCGVGAALPSHTVLPVGQGWVHSPSLSGSSPETGVC